MIQHKEVIFMILLFSIALQHYVQMAALEHITFQEVEIQTKFTFISKLVAGVEMQTMIKHFKLVIIDQKLEQEARNSILHKCKGVRVFFLNKTKITLKTGKKYFFLIVMAQDIREQKKIPLNIMTPSYILEVTILPLKDCKVQMKKLVFFQRPNELS